MRFDELNEDNYLLFAIKFYDNPQALTMEDFQSDLKRIRYVKRLLKKYKNTGELRTHLILNHLTILFNVFNDAAVPDRQGRAPRRRTRRTARHPAADPVAAAGRAAQ